MAVLQEWAGLADGQSFVDFRLSSPRHPGQSPASHGLREVPAADQHGWHLCWRRGQCLRFDGRPQRRQSPCLTVSVDSVFAFQGNSRLTATDLSLATLKRFAFLVIRHAVTDIVPPAQFGKLMLIGEQVKLDEVHEIEQSGCERDQFAPRQFNDHPWVIGVQFPSLFVGPVPDCHVELPSSISVTLLTPSDAVKDPGRVTPGQHVVVVPPLLLLPLPELPLDPDPPELPLLFDPDDDDLLDLPDDDELLLELDELLEEDELDDDDELLLDEQHGQLG